MLMMHKRRFGETAALISVFLLTALCTFDSAANRETAWVLAGLGVAKAEKKISGLSAGGAQVEVVQMDIREAGLLSELQSALGSDRLEDAASLLRDREKEMQEIFSGVMGKGLRRFWNGIMTDRLEGPCLVLKRPDTVFYGEFRDGKPQGKVMAIRVMDVDGPRYDYSVGTWAEGKMNGIGKIGYRSLQEKDTKNRGSEKTGEFHMDLLNGTVNFQSISFTGESSEWQLEVAEGVVKTDGRWSYDAENKAYFLPSDEDQNHVYVIQENLIEEARWQNMIPWE